MSHSKTKSYKERIAAANRLPMTNKTATTRHAADIRTELITVTTPTIMLSATAKNGM